MAIPIYIPTKNVGGDPLHLLSLNSNQGYHYNNTKHSRTMEPYKDDQELQHTEIMDFWYHTTFLCPHTQIKKHLLLPSAHILIRNLFFQWNKASLKLPWRPQFNVPLASPFLYFLSLDFHLFVPSCSISFFKPLAPSLRNRKWRIVLVLTLQTCSLDRNQLKEEHFLVHPRICFCFKKA